MIEKKIKNHTLLYLQGWKYLNNQNTHGWIRNLKKYSNQNISDNKVKKNNNKKIPNHLLFKMKYKIIAGLNL